MGVALVLFGLVISMNHLIVGMIMIAVGILLIVNRVQINISVSDMTGLAVMLFLIYILHSCANILHSSGY
jgi:hypothetical protein